MHLTTLLLSSLCLASTVLAAAPLLLTKRQIYTIDGKPNTDFHLAHDEHGRPIPPADFPYYDSLPHLQCEAHINYVPRISRGTWKKECPPKIYQWKVDHNVFESREVAAEAKANEAKRAEIEEGERQGMVLAEDAKIKKEAEEKKKEKKENGGEGVEVGA
ncbi:hypothetical protein Q7P35_000746 [Cladosporium inversicolor]